MPPPELPPVWLTRTGAPSACSISWSLYQAVRYGIASWRAASANEPQASTFSNSATRQSDTATRPSTSTHTFTCGTSVDAGSTTIDGDTAPTIHARGPG